MKKTLLAIVLAVMGAFGIWQIMRGLGTASEARQSAGWPTTTGTVLSAVVDSQISTSRHSNSRSYTPVIHYSYTVNGENFSGGTISPGRMWGSKSAYEAVRTFGAGSHPEVYYSPAHPADAVLVPGLHFYNCEPLLLGLLAFTFAFVFGVFSALGPRYGRPDGRGGYTFSGHSRVGNLFLVAFFTLALEFGLLWWAASP